MVTGLLGDTPWRTTGMGWAIRRDAGGLTPRLGGEVGAVPADQGRDIVAIPRARNSVVRR
jgi:hypothetical protein